MFEAILHRVFGVARTKLDPAQRADLRAVLAHPTIEIVPMKSATEAVAALPPAADVTITCSPVKGLDATLDLAESARALGHRVTPHLSARMVESAAHLTRTIDRLEALEITSAFVIAGDSAEPLGPYTDSIDLMTELLEQAPFVRHVGFAGYPDGHPLVDNEALQGALHAKQTLLRTAGVTGHVSTQMCFDAATIRQWLTSERTEGFDLPVHLGLAGVVDRARLLSMGMRLGVGTSLRYLSKNRSAITRLMTSSSYRPTDVLDDLAGDLSSLGVEGVHLFTFNQVGPTVAWLADQA